MDSFIDKFAQRKNAQEMIKANAMAEAAEREKMAAQLTEYEKALQEIRRCNLQNIENAEKVKELLTASLNKIGEVQKKDAENSGKTEEAVEEVKQILRALGTQMKDMQAGQQSRMEELLEAQKSQVTSALAEQKSQVEELLNGQSGKLEEKSAQTAELLEAQKKSMEELLQASNEFNHKEAVKVYRNVQAVIEGALPKQTEEITEAFKNAEGDRGTPKGMIVLGVLTFLAAAASVVIEVLRILGYL